MKIYFDKLSMYPRENNICNIAIPFAKGEVDINTEFFFYNDEYSFNYDRKITAKWDDGSPKWIYFDFFADLKGNEKTEINFSLEDPNLPMKEHGNIFVTNNNDIFVNNAGLDYKITNDAIYINNYKWEHFLVKGKAIKGVNNNFVVKENKLKTRISSKGIYSTDEYNILFEVAYTFYAGKPYVEVEHRIINDTDSDVFFDEICFECNFDETYGEKAYAVSNYKSKIVRTENTGKIKHRIDANYMAYTANEHYPEVFFGTYYAYWKDMKDKGVAVTQYQAYQNFPKGFEIDDKYLKVNILPKMEEEYEIPLGVSKTHKFFIQVLDEDTAEQINLDSLQLQYPDRCSVDKKVYQRANVLEDIYFDGVDNQVEQSLINMADNRGRGYGFLNWGDAPDIGYTRQGRGGGRLVWCNNEYDFPHASMMIYTNTGERRMLDYLLVTARHQMDVDICHSKAYPDRFKGQIEHSARHTEGDVKPCHQWIEGLLDYYHVTGEDRALRTAKNMGNNIMALLEKPRYANSGGISARETGWALRALIALFKETYDEKYIKPIEKIVDQFKEWKDKYGGWLAPYTDHVVIRVPFMISIAIGSLMRYYRVFPDEDIKAMIIEETDDMIEHCQLRDGSFMYKELPSLSHPSYNRIVLEALAYAYELTRDVEYLKKGLVTYHKNKYNSTSDGSKIKYDEFTVVQGGSSPKAFAQSYISLSYYYKYARMEGLI